MYYQAIDLVYPPSVNAQIIQNVTMHSPEDKTGEINHDATVMPNFFQLTSAAVRPEIPAPTSAPMTVCVQLIGIPRRVESRMKKQVEISIDSIILS